MSDLLSEEEFLDVAAKLKKFTKKKMKIEPLPYLRDYLVDMKELYSELTLEKVTNKVLDEKIGLLKDYQEMFNCHSDSDSDSESDDSVITSSSYSRNCNSDDSVLGNENKSKRRKILIKGKPGMGKSTLGKKIAHDWAKGVFKMFSIVFILGLNLVKPGQSIEKAIIEQYSVLKGLKISHSKPRFLLEKFETKCLLILDGLDELGLGQNEDVLKVVRDEYLLGCGVILTSRPHSTREIEEHFSVIIRVQGFIEEEAEKFVSKFIKDEKKIKRILALRPSDYRENFPIHQRPFY